MGGGGHCESCIGSISGQRQYKIHGILDQHAAEILGVPVIGNDALLSELVAQGRFEFLVTVGQIKSAVIRKRIFESIGAAGGKPAVVICAGAWVATSAKIGEGSLVMRGALVNESAVVGENCIINNLSLVEHGAVLGAHSHVATGALINGECRVGPEVLIGSGAILIQGVEICAGTIVGAGSVVHRDIRDAGVYAGNPARRIG